MTSYEAIGNMVDPSLKAAQILEQEGIKATVVNARFSKPLDRTLISRIARKHRYLITVEEHVLNGGFGSAVMEVLEQEGIYGNEIKRIGVPDVFVEHGSVNILREQLGLTPEGIAREVRTMMRYRPAAHVSSR